MGLQFLCPNLIDLADGCHATAQVCNCVGQASDDEGYAIDSNCNKVNVNECSMGTAACHRNAVCLDKDAAVNASQRYECVCPPGLIGDGVSTCSVNAYETRFSLVRRGVSHMDFDTGALKIVLYSTGVLSNSIQPERVRVVAYEYNGGAQPSRRALSLGGEESGLTTPGQAKLANYHQQVERHGGRALLQASDTQIDVTVFSETVAEMDQITQSTNVTLLQSSGYEISNPPASFKANINNADEPTATLSPGFQIGSVQYDDTTAQWLVDVKYTPSIPDTITSLYISRPGTTVPYSQAVKNTYYISKHPCLLSSSVCCLNTYKDEYALGAFESNITQVLGSCDAAMQTRDTIGLFSPQHNQYLVDHALDAYPDSSVQRIAEGHVRLRIALTDLSTRGLAMRTPMEGNSTAGYQLTFFVGMSYFTLIPANAMAVVASQTSITLTISNSITFSFASAQDYSFVKYITLSVMQNKWVDGLIERKMQFVQVWCDFSVSFFRTCFDAAQPACRWVWSFQPTASSTCFDAIQPACRWVWSFQPTASRTWGLAWFPLPVCGLPYPRPCQTGTTRPCGPIHVTRATIPACTTPLRATIPCTSLRPSRHVLPAT